MRFFRILTTACLLLLKISPCNAQQGSVLFNSERNYSFNYRMSSPQGSPEITRNILENLIQGTGVSLMNAAYTLGMNQNLDITINATNYMQVNIRNSFIQPSGNVYFRNFYVGDLLIPSAMNMTVNILDNRNNLIQSLQISNLNTANNFTTGIGTNVYPSNQTKYSLQPLNMMLFYSAQTIINFNQRMALINDYYESNMNIDNIQNRLYAIAYVTPDNMETTLAVLQQAENEVNNIESKNFNNALNLNKFDPINLNQRIITVRNSLAQKRMALNQAYNDLDSYYYTKGFEALSQNNKNLATTQFNKSLSLNPMYAPAAYQIAKIEFENGNLISADLKLREVWFNMRPNQNTYDYCVTLFKNIYINYIASADILKDKNNFEEALNLYDKAQKLCTELSFINCNEEVKTKIKICRQGNYNDLMTESKNFANTGKTNEAYQQLNEAQKYIDTYPNDIQDLGKENETIKAIKYYEYQKACADAKLLYEKGDYNEAFSQFEDAHEFEAEFNFSPSLIALELEQKNAKKVILLKVDVMHKHLEKNDFNLAKTELEKITTLQEFYKLKTDKEINLIVDPLKEKIIEKTCIDANVNFQSAVEKANKSFMENNYIIAIELYDNAIKINDDNAACNIQNNDAVKIKRDSILPAATYQKLINNILDMQLAGKYKEAVGKYKEALAYHATYELSKFKINNKDMFNFGKDNFKNGALDYLANYFQSNNEIEKALELYKVLLTRNYSVRYIKNSLETLGSLFANRDKKTQVINPKEKVLEYVANNKDLKYFKKTYLKYFESK